MLLALLLVCLTAVTSASVINLGTFKARTTDVSLEEFIQILERPDTLAFGHCIIDIICECGFGTEYLAAFLSRGGDSKRFAQHLIASVGKHYRLDFLSFLAEKGFRIFSRGTLVNEGAGAGQGDLLTFCCELGADPNGIYNHVYLNDSYKMIDQENYDFLYYLIEEGVEIDQPNQLGRVIFSLGTNLRKEPLLQRNYEFACSLLERTDNMKHFAAMLSFGVKFENRMLTEKLLGYEKTLAYLRRAKYATGVLLGRHEGLLRELFQEIRNEEGESVKTPHQVSWRIQSDLQNEFLNLVQNAEGDLTLHEPLTTQDLQLASEQQDLALRVYVFMLGIPFLLKERIQF